MVLYVVLIIAVVLFLVFLLSIHETPSASNSKISRLYIDQIIFDVTDTSINHPHKHIEPAISHFDEFVQVLSELIPHKHVFQTGKIAASVQVLLALPIVQKYIHPVKYLYQESVPFNNSIGFGGCYYETQDNCGLVHVIGLPEQVLELCSNVHDKEEILRVADRWQKQGLKCFALASGDVKHTKNVLKRGVKEKMMFLGLFAVQT